MSGSGQSTRAGIAGRVGRWLAWAVTCVTLSGVALAETAGDAAGADRETTQAPRDASLAEAVRALRADVREWQDLDAGRAAGEGTATRDRLLRRSFALTDRVVAKPELPGAAARLIHLHHSARWLDPEFTAVLDGRSHERIARERLAWVRVQARAEADAALHAHARLEEALLDEAKGNAEAALRGGRAATLEAAAVGHRQTLYRAHWLIARRHRASGEAARALASYRAAVAVLEEMKADLVARSRDDAFSFRREVEPVYRGLVEALLEEARRSEREAPQDLQAWLEDVRGVVERSRQAELRDYFEDDCLGQTDSTAPDAIPGAVVVYPIALDDRLEILVGRNGRWVRRSAPVGRAELMRRAIGLRVAVEDRLTQGYRPWAAALYETILRPIEDQLEAAEGDTLVFVPGPILRQIPLAALWDRRTERHLVESFALAVAPSLSLTEPRAIDRERAVLLAGGLTQAVQGFSPLPNVEQEIAAIGRHFPTRALVDASFRTDDFERVLQTASFDVLHIATHGRFTRDHRGSFILTWDGRLPMDRLAEGLGRARFRTEQPVELLVLSACETAVGDDRAALGLAGAALRMGVRSVVGSLWSVDDLASSRLMERFYDELAVGGRSRAEALRAAQRWMLTQPDFRHPIDWSAFLLIDSWL